MKIIFSPLLFRAALLFGLAVAANAQTQMLNVRDFDAKCDGATDDTLPLRSAFSAAVAAGQTLTFPAGATCVVNSNQNIGGPAYGAIFLPGNGTSVLKVQGNGATLLDTITPTAARPFELTLGTYGTWALIDIEGLNFTSTRTPSVYTETALAVGNGFHDVVNRMTVSGCVFTNYTTSIGVNGTLQSLLTHNVFYQTNRDYGTLSGTPNQAIWVGANPDAPAYSTEVSWNTYNGCTASANLAGSVQHFCGDGLAIGRSHGWKVHDNTIHGFSFEGIFAVNRVSLPGAQPAYPTAIYNNHVDATRVAGQRPNSYSIRCDEPGCDIHDNQLVEAVQGILVNGIDGQPAGLTIPDVTIHDNSIAMTGNVPLDPDHGAGSQYGILTQAAVHPIITNNRIVWLGGHANADTTVISGITLGEGTVDPVVNANTVDGGTPGTSRTALHAYEFFHQGVATLNGTNRAIAAEVGVYTSGANPTVVAPFFLFTGNLKNTVAGSKTNLNISH